MGTRLRLRAVFDGEVLRPERPVDLRANATYMVTVEEADEEESGSESSYPLTAIRALATDMGVSDLAAGHDRYAHGGHADGDHAP